MADLTVKEKLFVAYYLGECQGNATRAALKAGFRKSPEGAAVAGHRLIRKDKIRAAIEAGVAAVMPADEVLARLAEIASGSVDKFFRISIADDGTESLKQDMVRAKRLGALRTARKVKPTKHGYEVELIDPVKALDKLGQYHGLWDKKDKPAQADVMEALNKLKARQAERKGEDEASGDGAE